jgi:hypothetical protein
MGFNTKIKSNKSMIKNINTILTWTYLIYVRLTLVHIMINS